MSDSNNIGTIYTELGLGACMLISYLLLVGG